MPQLLDPKTIKLPSLPRAAMHILELVRDPDVELQDLGKAIEQDPALAARLLRLSNSSFFGLCRQVSSIRQALMVLGLRQVKMAALSFSLTNALPTKDGSRLLSETWRRVLTNALGARIAASTFRMEPEEAFLAGMMQDVAMIIFASELADVYSDVLEQSRAEGAAPLFTLERDAIGIDHAELGANLLREWNLPDALLDAVRNHHQVDLKSALAARRYDLTTLLATTECITDFLLNPSEAYFEMFNLVAESYGENGSEIDKFLQMLELQVEEMAELLDLELPPGNGADTILERARQIAASMEAGVEPDAESSLRAADVRSEVFGAEALPLRLRQELSQGNRQHWPVCVILARVRGVAQLDRDGKIEESLDLVHRFAKHLCQHTRSSDSVFQFNRDTLCVLTPKAAIENVPIILSRLKSAGEAAFGVVTIPYSADRLADGETVLEQAMHNLSKAEAGGEPCVSQV